MQVQITPAYPPCLSGVGDYAAALAQHRLFDGARLNTVVASPNSPHECISETIILRQLTAKALCSVLEDIEVDSVLLHFSGYGYARWGLCYWLIKGLQDWKLRQHDRRIIVIFHEVFASGPVWRSSFWTSSFQRRIARSLAHLCDSGFVTSEASFSQLIDISPDKVFEILPVFSNLGELNSVVTLDDRQPYAVVFGGAGTRQRTYKALKQHEHTLGNLFDQLDISELIDIGPGSVAPSNLAARPVRALGALVEKHVSDLLAMARLGLIDYPRNFLTKSGVTASYFAHGVLVVNTSSIGRLPADMAEGREFISIDHLPIKGIDFVSIAIAGHSWYQPHRLDETVLKIANTLL